MQRTDGADNTDGATHWDGADLAWKGLSQNKPTYSGIEFLDPSYTSFKNYYTKANIKKYTGLDKDFAVDLTVGKHLATNGENKERVLFLSSKFMGNSVFWKPNYSAPENQQITEVVDGKTKIIRKKYNFKYYFYYG